MAVHSVDEVNEAAKLGKKNNSEVEQTQLSLAQSLALYFDLKLSVRKYNLMRSVVNAVSKNCFPSYYVLYNEMEALLPKPLIISEDSAEVPLQSLLNRTAQSLLELMSISENTDVVLECKWGFDGSSGHSNYKQNFSDENITDEFLFVVALVPLKVITKNLKKDLWVNKTPSSPFLCRPLKFIFSRENKDLIHKTEKDISYQIDKLEAATFYINNRTVNVSYLLHLTMIDGAVANILSERNSTSTCYLCGSTPKVMNSFHAIPRSSEDIHLKYGISSLHAWIKCFECILHIAYRLPFKQWRKQKPEEKELFSRTKEKICRELKTELGLNVDKVRTGYGTSNDGNTARKFFNNAEIAAKVTGVDVKLIKNFAIILKVLSCGKTVKTDAFKILLDETFEIYLKNYEWYYMPVTVHKILVHGVEIIQNFSLPIGMLSEDALEARHKEFRNVRLNHARKVSREATNRDILKNLLLSSEPKIVSHRKLQKKSSTSYEEIENYIVAPDADDNSDSYESSLEIDLEAFVSDDSESD